jgi:hypothetical protein
MVRMWRNMKLLIRGGRAHDPTGVNGTREGELAVVCPACPIDGVNLPENWKDAPQDKQYVITHVRQTQRSDLI